MRIAAARAFAFATLAFASSACAESPVGVWLTKDKDAHVRIADCGGSLCGTIVWLKDPIDEATGKPLADKHNSDPAKRSRPVLGIQIMYGMTANGPDKWSGRFYNVDDGRIYDGNLMMTGPASVKVEGCMLGICLGEAWQRVESAGRLGKQSARQRQKT